MSTINVDFLPAPHRLLVEGCGLARGSTIDMDSFDAARRHSSLNTDW
jgi:hypothetical protein